MPLAFQSSPPERYGYYAQRGYVDIGRPAPVDPDALPAAMRNALNTDPASFVPGAVPNFGEHVAPHIATYAGMWATAANVYDISDEATRNSPENAERMRLTLAIEGCLDSRRKAVARMPWHIEPEDAKDQKQLEIAGILTALVRKTPMFTNLCEWLGLRVWFGRAGAMFALDERHVNRQPYIGMSKRVPWYPVHGDKILMRYDDGKRRYEGGQLGIRIAGSGNGIPEDRRETSQFGMAFFLRGYEREHFIFARHNIEDGPFFQPRLASKIMGVGVRDKIYQTWLTMVQLEQDALTWISRSALGVRLWRYPMGDAKAKAAIEAALKKSLSGGAADFLVPVPPGEYSEQYGVQMIEPGTGGVEVVRGLIQDYYMDMITKFILGQTVTRDTDPEGIGGGSWLPKLMTYYDILTSDADVQSEALTDDYIAVLVKKNWLDYQNCWFRFCIDTGDPQAESKIAAAEKLYQMNVPLVTEELYKLAGLTKPNPGDNVVRLQDNQAAMQPPAGQPGQPSAAPGGDIGDGRDELAPAQRQDGPAVDETGEPETEGEPGSVQDFAADAPDLLNGGAADGMPDSAFPPEALAKGTAAEAEHTSNPAIAKEIAKDQMVADGLDAYDDEPSPVEDQLQVALATLVDHGPEVARQVRAALTPFMSVEDQVRAALAPLIEREPYAARWVTIGGDAFDGKQHVGGTHVEIDDDGKITKGPDALTGKKVGELRKSSEKESSGTGQKPKDSLESLDTGSTSPPDKSSGGHAMGHTIENQNVMETISGGTDKQIARATEIRDEFVRPIADSKGLTEKGRDFMRSLSANAVAWIEAKAMGYLQQSQEMAEDLASNGKDAKTWQGKAGLGHPLFGKYIRKLVPSGGDTEIKDQPAESGKTSERRLATRHDRRSGFPGYRIGEIVTDKAGKKFVVTTVHKPEFIVDGQFEGMKHAVTVRPATAEESRRYDLADRLYHVEKELRTMSVGPDDERDREAHNERIRKALAEKAAIEAEEKGGASLPPAATQPPDHAQPAKATAETKKPQTAGPKPGQAVRKVDGLFKTTKSGNEVLVVPEKYAKVSVGDFIQPMDDNWDDIPDVGFTVAAVGEPFAVYEGKKMKRFVYLYLNAPKPKQETFTQASSEAPDDPIERMEWERQRELGRTGEQKGA